MGKDKIHWRISAEDVLAVLEYYNAASLKAQQTALSGTATQLEKLGYADLMVDGAPSPHQPDATLRWLIDRPRS
ncbi:hypothetical protein AO268_08050 [Pseudomonas sp. ICMP 8385]|nr:hypothetical protein AO268_08050 [Pseudomonas sp. ICMP 8385]